MENILKRPFLVKNSYFNTFPFLVSVGQILISCYNICYYEAAPMEVMEVKKPAAISKPQLLYFLYVSTPQPAISFSLPQQCQQYIQQ